MFFHHTEADAGVYLNFLLEIGGKVLVALRSDDSKGIDIEAADTFARSGIDAETQTPSDGLAALAFSSHFTYGANLEDVRIVPALAQRGVREDELQRGLQAEQLLLVAHDEVVRVIVRFRVAAGVLENLNGLCAHLLLVDGEIAFADILSGGAKVYLVKECLVIGVLSPPTVFLLEDAGIRALHWIPVSIVPAVFVHRVDEEQ